MIRLENVRKNYEDENALDGVSLHVRQGEFVFLIGKSGAGKTTLINLLLKDLEPDAGKIVVNGVDLGMLKQKYLYRYRRFLGVVFQDYRLLPDRTVYENVAFAQRVVEVPSRKIRSNVMEMLEQVGLARKAGEYPAKLSGGEKQRVAIARAMVNRPFLLLADEPTRNLDRRNSIEVIKMMEEVNRNGTTVLVSTHNKEVVNALRKRVVTLEDGKVINDSNPGRYYYGL